jgi:AGCS family alanine or glycine:cation symporter
MDKAIDFSDASLFAMSIPNLIGVYLLLPVVRREYADFLAHARAVDAGSGK